jgi:hypothetical protein
MGLTRIKRIANEHISAKSPHDHPTAAINMGTLAGQRVIKVYLSSISNRIDEAKLSGATLIIIRRVLICQKNYLGSSPRYRGQVRELTTRKPYLHQMTRRFVLAHFLGHAFQLPLTKFQTLANNDSHNHGILYQLDIFHE